MIKHKKKLTISNTGRLLFEFEEKFYPALSKIKIGHWNAWRIVKTDLFFECLYHDLKRESPYPSRKKSKTGAFKKIINIIKTFAKLLFLAFQKRSRKLYLIITLSANKTYLRADGKLQDVVVDYFIESGIIQNYIYIEQPDKHQRHLLPSVAQTQFYTSQFSILISLISKFLRLFNAYKNQSKALSAIWNDAFNQYGIYISTQQLQNLFIYFHSEYLTYLTIYKILRPSWALFNDQMFSGRMAAAKRLDIKSIEFQHGLMDEYYPQYLMHPAFRGIKGELPLADIIAVFGEFHKNQLLNKGFYSEKEVFVLGKFGMTNGTESISQFSDRKTIVFITQGELLFKQTIKDLETIVTNLDFKEYTLIIKAHPLEPPNLIESYNHIHSRFSKQIKVIQKEYSISQILPVVDYVIGYNSTVLLEAVYYKKVVFSLCDEHSPQGIFSVIGNDQTLKEYLIVCENADEFIHLITNRTQINNENKSISNYLFDDNYEQNCINLLENNVKT